MNIYKKKKKKRKLHDFFYNRKRNSYFLCGPKAVIFIIWEWVLGRLTFLEAENTLEQPSLFLSPYIERSGRKILLPPLLSPS